MAGGIGTIGGLLGKTNAAGALLVSLDGGVASATTFLAGDGSAAAPSYAFASDPDTGMYLSGTEIRWAVAGVQVMSLNNFGTLRPTGNVDIAFGSLVTLGQGVRWLTSATTGLTELVNIAQTAGVGFDVATDAVLKVRTRAQSAYATVDCLRTLTQDGSVGAPSVSFASGGSNDGFFLADSATIGVASNGTFPLAFAATGMALGSDATVLWTAAANNPLAARDLQLMRTAAAVLKVGGAGAVYGTVDCLGLRASGVAGVTYSGVANNITVVNGIVTAAS